ncbi:hypothetical protein [Marinitoga lauensis]|uniref:hypothetical protein n=1 Tax=Marinitoga lauensis TaxID=2201189 RepID=UPI001013B967|nr:hypothetical protein [Marinitoga lauensis]
MNTEKIKNRIKDISNDIKLLQYSLKKHEEEVININEEVVENMIKASVEILKSDDHEKIADFLTQIIDRIEVKQSERSKRNYIAIKLKGISNYISKLHDL